MIIAVTKNRTEINGDQRLKAKTFNFHIISTASYLEQIRNTKFNHFLKIKPMYNM